MDMLFVVVVFFAAALALAFAAFNFAAVKKMPEGTERMSEIAAAIRVGANAFINYEYRILAIVVACIAVLMAIITTWHAAAALLIGAVMSASAGFIGMKIATYANVRVSNRARESRSIGDTVKVAFRGGSVMGLCVGGCALLGLFLVYLIFGLGLGQLEEVSGSYTNLLGLTFVPFPMTLSGYALGCSLVAMFNRVGGGIYTKAADMGADLVGKTEAHIPEDDPRNPATIADNVGDNVGDVAGMGADLYESYCGAILATMALGASAFFGDVEWQTRAVLAPMCIAAVGVVLSVLGIYAVRTREGADLQELLGALSKGTNLSASLIAVLSFGIFYVLGFDNWWMLSLSVLSGLLAGVIIGKATEYYTSHSYKPTQKLAESAKTGSATVIISGMGLGMISTAIPVVTIAVAIMLSYLFATGFSLDPALISKGLYGISIAAVGMLSTLGITLATDAYGPIADNAGGNAQMSGLDPEVRQKTDVLDALGNTTAATGKGFAIGSAALTALALLASYIEEVKIGLLHIGRETLTLGDKIVDVASATIPQMVEYYQVNLMNPRVLVGVFIGAMMSFLFCGLTMNAVGRAAQKMVTEVRRQFAEIKGILTGERRPDYARCVEISTLGAQREMIFPSLIAIAVPVLTGLCLGVAGVMGLLAGGLGSGFVLY